MKASIYVNYTTRSLLRGGQRTVLAIFCIAVGVMAIVALQLVGRMINNSVTSNVRDANGGDIAVSAPIAQNDLPYFDSLKRDGTISAYTPIITLTGSTGLAASLTQTFTVQVVDPATFPVVTPPTFNAPADGSISSLLRDNQVIVDQNFADQYNHHVGDTLNLHATNSTNHQAVTIPVKIAGIVANAGVFAQTSGVLLLSVHDYQDAAAGATLSYSSVDVATPDEAHIAPANSAIQQHFRMATTQTTADALKSEQQYVDLVNKFLEIAGLLALLIGGVGIVNTMQVLLSRRRIEIAMLKTVGYRRIDLYLLFGLEAGLLGLVGGIIGAAVAIALSYLILQVVQHAFLLHVTFVLDPVIVLGGVLIGLLTALIFGLMPIVQAGNIRPLSVMRELPGSNRAGSFFLTIGLVLLLSILFCLLAIFILNSALWGISAVYGTLVFLALLSLLFSLVVLLVSSLPVPERYSLGYLALIALGFVIAAALLVTLPAFGVLMLLLTLVGLFIVLLPRSWKATTKMALRNIGRQRGRTTTTLLALFVGVFTIGLILVLGQDIRDVLNNVISNNLSYNVIVLTHGSDGATLQSQLGSIPGLPAGRTQHHPYVQDVPQEIDGVSVTQYLTPGQTSTGGGFGGIERQAGILLLSSIQGYDVAGGQIPDTKQNLTITSGRNLQASDVGTDNVLINTSVFDQGPFKGHIHLQSTITLKSSDGQLTRTVTVVGIYNSTIGANYGAIFAPNNTVTALTTPGQRTDTFYMKIDNDKVGKALDRIGAITPNASAINFADIGSYIDKVLNNVLLVLITVASLSLLAGVIIIANAVALAMLERRRELGILKSVGYTSQTILSEVLLENGVVGGTGALLAMLLVTLATGLLGKLAFNANFGVSWYLALGVIALIAFVAMITAALVAWGAVRVRPLEVLRYE